MALSDEEKALVSELTQQIEGRRAPSERNDAYFEGTWRLEQLGLAVPPELEKFVTVVNWPRITAGEVERRCDVEGFRRPGDESLDEDMAEIWEANDLAQLSQLGHLDSLVLSSAYTCVGTREDDEPLAGVPLITVESAMEMTHKSDPRTREVRAALRRPSQREATLYLPNETIWMERSSGRWQDVDRDEHNLGTPPVTPLVNQGRLRNSVGVSELVDVIPLTDAACRALTNAQVATEVLAIPQRYVLGASPKDFVDAKTGLPVPTWETYFGAVWALTNPEAKVGQFQAADLGNFEKIVNHYANLASGVSGLPTRFYGQYTTNPPSEGSIVADETRLIMNAYRKHRAWGAGWKRTMRLSRRYMDGDWDRSLIRLETMWRNPETPTRAQTADAVVKLVQAGILPIEAAWEELGYSPTRRAVLAQMRKAQIALDPLAAAAASFRVPAEVGAGGAPAGGTGARPTPTPTAGNPKALPPARIAPGTPDTER